MILKLVLLTLVCIMGSINSGNIIPDSQNPVLVYYPNTFNNQRIDVRFSLDTTSAGLNYGQYIALVFPPNISDLQFDQGSTVKYQCSLSDATTQYTVTADKPTSSSEGNIAYCKLNDLVSNSIKAGTKLRLSVTLVSVKITANYVRSIRIFTSTSNKPSKIIIDQLAYLGNIALYADPFSYSTKAIDITSSAILLGSSPVTNIYPYQTFDISLNIKSNIFINSDDLLITFKFDKNVVSPAQSAISNSLNLGTSTDPLNAALAGSLTVTSNSTGDFIILSGVSENLVPNRQFQVVLKSWKANDKLTNQLSPLEMMVFYKNTYSLISYVKASTNFFKISYSTITLTAGHPEGWDIFRNGVFPMKFSFSSNIDLPNGGFVLIQQSNTVDLSSRFNFVASTCDFSENDNNFDQGFSKRPVCYPIRTDFNYPGSPSTGYNGSGIFFNVKSIQANKVYYVTVWGSADACGGNTLASFGSTTATNNGSGTYTSFSFQATVYNGINANQVNENRFTNIQILGQSVPQSMTNKCWNSMTQIMSNIDSTDANNSPAIFPFSDSLYKTFVKVKDSNNALCNPGTTCHLTNDINLYREFSNLKLINHTTAYTASNYLADMYTNYSTFAENFIYGTNVISNNSYFGIAFDTMVSEGVFIHEVIPTPVAWDANTSGTPTYRLLPGRLEVKFQKSWFSAGDTYNTGTGCYLSWGIDRKLGANTDIVKVMKNFSTNPTPTISDCSQANGGSNFISTYVHPSTVTACATTSNKSMLDQENSQIPLANTSNTFTHYKILSKWNNSGEGDGSAAAKVGSGYTDGDSNFSFPLLRSLLNTKMADIALVAGPPSYPAYNVNLRFAMYSTCLKWNPPTTIKSLYTSLDVQLNWLYTTSSSSLSSNIFPHRAIRLIKLFPEGGVFQDISSGTASRLITTPPDSITSGTARSYKLHFSLGSSNTTSGICLIEISGAGLQSTSDGSSGVLAIWIGFGVILEQDYNDLSSNYPLAPLSNASYNSYGLQSGYFMNIKENWTVHGNFSESDVFIKVSTSIDDINKHQLRYLLSLYSYTGKTTDPTLTSAYTATKTPIAITDFFSQRSNYLFLMGSLVFITGITSNQITTNSNADNLLIPIYCPIHDTSSTSATKFYNGIPSLYMAYLTMSAYNSITSVNRIYSHKVNANMSSTIITAAAAKPASIDYYRASLSLVTNDLLHHTDNYNKYLFTLRWAPYTSTISANDNTLYFYYNTSSATVSAPSSANCTGHIVLINNKNISIDKNNLVKYGFNDVSSPFLYDGTKKFYYLGSEFQKAILMGLTLANNTSATASTFTIGAFSQSNLSAETSTYYLTGIRRPSVDVFYQNGNYVSPFDSIAYFCSSAHNSSPQLFSNYVYFPNSIKKSFIVDFNPPVTSPKTFTVTITQDKSETIFRNDVAGNVKISATLPSKIPGGLSLRFFANSNAFNSNTICGVVTTTGQPVLECNLLNQNTMNCPTNRTDITFTICCYNVSIASDTFSLNSLYVFVPNAPNADQTTKFNTNNLYDAKTQIDSTPISWSTGQASGTDVIGSQSAKITKVDYTQVVQESGLGVVIFTISLPREPVRNMALTLVGDFSGMLIQNNIPRCEVSFGNNLGSNWDTSGDALLESCDVSGFSGSTAPVIITTKNLVYKCGLSFASKTVSVKLWPIIQVNWANNPYSSNNYKVTMTLNNNSFDPIANNSITFNISSNLTYSTKPGFIGQWDNLCTVSSVIPKIPGEYSDYQFDFDLDTNKSALANSLPNEVSIFFPHVHYGASIKNILCFYNNSSMNCSFTEEGILNIRFTSTLPVGSGKKISIIITGIYNPSVETDIYFPCTVNNTNFSTGVRLNLITGSGKLIGGFPISSTVNQGVLRFVNPLTISDINPRNVSTHTFRITFDNAIGITSTPIIINNTPQIIVTFPYDYNLSWYTTVKATAIIDEYTNDTSNVVSKTSTINPTNVIQSGNRITIVLPNNTYTFNSNWRYWDVKISQITNPTDATSTSANNTTGPYSLILTNSNYSSIYRSFNNLNNLAFNSMSTQIDNWISFNRGVEFKFDNTKWVIDVNTSGILNTLTLRPGRFILSTFTVKSNSSSSIQPKSSSILLNDQIFRLAANSYSISTALFQPVSFYIGAPCGTAPGRYIVYFSLNGENVGIFFAPLSPVQILLDTVTTGTVNFSTPPSIPAGASTLIYYSLSEPNVDNLNISWISSETTKNDSTAAVSSTQIPAATIKAGSLFANNNNIFSTFSISNLQATNNQLFKPNPLNSCYSWGSNLLTITISGTQAIIPNLFDFTSSFKYFNSDSDSTLTSKNSIKFTFTPPYSPIYLYCALVCYNRNYPSDDLIRSTTSNSSSDNLTRYYYNMFNTKTSSDIIFDNLVRGQRYKLRCIITSTEGTLSLRTSAAVSVEQLSSTNGTNSQFIPTLPTKTQCLQYYFTSDPGQATKIAIINYCQKLYSSSGWSTSGCIICTDSGLTYTSPGLSLPQNITCLNTATKSRLRFLQTTTNSTVLTPTTAGSTVNPSLVNQSNPITYSVCPIQHPVCPTDVSGNKLYSDYFNQLISDTKTSALFNTNLGIVNVPVNNTYIVTDLVAPDISKNFVVNILTLNLNGLVQFSASFPTALRCSWQISESSSPPASGTAIDQCSDVQWCGKNFNVGTVIANTSTDVNNLKPFSSGKNYGLYFACFNDVPYSSSISGLFNVPLSLPNTPTNTNTNNGNTNQSNTNTTTPTSADFTIFSYFIILIFALLI